MGILGWLRCSEDVCIPREWGRDLEFLPGSCELWSWRELVDKLLSLLPWWPCLLQPPCQFADYSGSMDGALFTVDGCIMKEAFYKYLENVNCCKIRD